MDVDVVVPVWAALLVLHPHDVQRLVDDGGLAGAALVPDHHHHHFIIIIIIIWYPSVAPSRLMLWAPAPGP